MKIDTDGYDLKVLQGASQLIERDRPIIYGEFAAHCMNWHGQTVGDVVDFAKAKHYSTYGKLPGMWRFSKTINAVDFIQDLLLVPDEEVPNVAWCIED